MSLAHEKEIQLLGYRTVLKSFQILCNQKRNSNGSSNSQSRNLILLKNIVFLSKQVEFEIVGNCMFIQVLTFYLKNARVLSVEFKHGNCYFIIDKSGFY